MKQHRCRLLVCRESYRSKGRSPQATEQKFLQQIGAIPWTLTSELLRFRTTGPTLDPSTQALVQLHNESPIDLVTPIRLDFDDKEKLEEKPDEETEDLQKPYKEVLRSPFRAANQGEWEMHVWCRMFQQTLDGPARGWFDCLPNGCIDNWTDLREAFVERFSLRRRCCKDPTEVSRIVRKANEALPDFKERWTEEMSYIPDVPIVMQISSFMSNSKCPELARRFSDQVPKTVTEMMKRVDDFVKSEEAFKNIKLPKGEFPEKGAVAQFRGSRPPRHSYGNGPPRTDSHHRRDHYQPYVAPRGPDRSRGDGRSQESEPRWEEKILINPAFPEQAITIRTQFSTKCREQLIRLLKSNMDVFAGVPRRLMRHALNFNNFIPSVAQKQRVLGTEKSRVVTREVEEWVKARIVRPVKYPTWISNPVLVLKVDDTWRMCIDFKNLNTACPKDYYPLPEIDLKIEAVIGHPFKCFLDAYKGYHQIQMSKEDEEKTAFYPDQGTNLEAYVDDMIIKSKTKQEMIMDIAKTFDNQRKINMKLNPMKCLFGVTEGKFLGYMVTSEGITANPKKTKAIADMQSPKTLKEMQSLSGKLAGLN
ncbi:reverse transcriptase domain-containing protein [Tanacetum coccineum]|uniref:Reverse transcriptase domain-containing protein n=1 Tax=Tanacetum coccineum TaxID=301880 RepID=A0ABQ4WQF6_9ASTR